MKMSLTPNTNKEEARKPSALLEEAIACVADLRRMISSKTRNAGDVDEILQETFLHLVEIDTGKRTLSAVRNARSVIFVIARNITYDRIRYAKVVPIDLVADISGLEIADDSATPEEIFEQRDQIRLIVAIVGTLPNICRQVFVMRKVYGYHQQEIAKLLKISENTVEQHLTKAARRVAAALFDRPLPPLKTPVTD